MISTSSSRILFILLTFATLLFSPNLQSQNCTVSGVAPDYKGKELLFYTTSEPVTHFQNELGTVKVAADGSFSITMTIRETTEIYTHLEKYRGTLVVKPGESYQVTLPPYTARTVTEARSPFFEPQLYWLGINNKEKNDINLTIRSFVAAYNQLTAQNTMEIYHRKSKESVAMVMQKLDTQFDDVKDPYFVTLKKYYFAELEYTVSQQKPEAVIQKYFTREAIHLANPAYQKAFSLIYTDYLGKLAKEISNKSLQTMVNSGNYSGVVSWFVARGYSNDFAALATIKGLYDGYYNNGFAKEGVIKALQQATQQSPPLLNETARRAFQRLSSMKTGTKAPAFNLKNQEGTIVSAANFKDKFLYLVFFRSDSRECRAELDSLVSIEKKLRQVMNVAAIAVDEDFGNAVTLWKEKNYNWPLLDGSNRNVLIQDYNVKVTPTFYLLAPDGTFRLSQAPPPSRRFDDLFLKIYREYNFKAPAQNSKR